MSVAWRIHTCEMTHAYVWNDSCIRVTWLILCVMWHGGCTCVTWLINMRDMTYFLIIAGNGGDERAELVGRNIYCIISCILHSANRGDQTPNMSISRFNKVFPGAVFSGSENKWDSWYTKPVPQTWVFGIFKFSRHSIRENWDNLEIQIIVSLISSVSGYRVAKIHRMPLDASLFPQKSH